METREGVLPALPSNYSLSICYYTGGMKMHAVIIRSILWGFRLFHLTPLVAIYLLQIGKWPAAIIAAVWPVWLVGLLLFELEILRKWLKPVLTAEERVLLRDAEAVMRGRNSGLARYMTGAMRGSTARKSIVTRRSDGIAKRRIRGMPRRLFVLPRS